MLLTEQKRAELTPMFETLLDTINHPRLQIGRPTCAVIIKLTPNEETVGAMTASGTYTPCYSVPLQVDLLATLREIFAAFRAEYSRNRTLFFRYNRQRQKLQMFACCTMALASEVL